MNMLTNTNSPLSITNPNSLWYDDEDVEVVEQTTTSTQSFNEFINHIFTGTASANEYVGFIFLILVVSFMGFMSYKLIESR